MLFQYLIKNQFENLNVNISQNWQLLWVTMDQENQHIKSLSYLKFTREDFLDDISSQLAEKWYENLIYSTEPKFVDRTIKDNLIRKRN